MAINTTAVLSNTQQTAFSKMAMLEFQPLIQFAQFGKSVQWSGQSNDPFQSKTVKFPIWNNINASTSVLNESTDPTSRSLSNSFVTLTMNEHGFTTSLTKLLEKTSYQDLSVVAQMLANNLQFSQDIIARDAFDAETGSAYNTYVGQTSKSAITSGNTVTNAVISAARNALLRARVPGYNKEGGGLQMLNKGNYYMGIIHPDVLYDYQTETGSGGWLLPQEYANSEALYNFETGMFGGVRFVASDLATIDYDAGAGNATDVNGAKSAGATVVDVTAATGIAAGNTISITSTVSADDAAALGIDAGSNKFTYAVASVDTNALTITTCLAINNIPYDAEADGLIVDIADTDVVASGVDVYTTYIFGAQAIGHVYAEKPSFSITMPKGGLERRTDYNWYGIFGFGAVRAKSLHKIHSASSLGRN